MSQIQSLGPSPPFANLSGVQDEKVREHLEELQRFIRDAHQLIEYGPVPGAYCSVEFGWSQPLAGPFWINAYDLRAVIPVSMIPVAVTAFADGGTDLDFQLLDDASNVFFGPETVTSGTASIWKDATDFPLGRYQLPAGVVALNGTGFTGNIHHLKVILFLKRAARMDG